MVRVAEKTYYTTREVAAIMRVNVRTVREWIKRGDLPAVHLRRGYRIAAVDFEEFVGQRRTNKEKHIEVE